MLKKVLILSLFCLATSFIHATHGLHGSASPTSYIKAPLRERRTPPSSPKAGTTKAHHTKHNVTGALAEKIAKLLAEIAFLKKSKSNEKALKKAQEKLEKLHTTT